MAEKVSLSSERPGFEDVAEFYNDAERSIRYFYAAATDLKFAGYSRQELENELLDRLRSLDQMCEFAILAALEASFRTDFHRRCSKRLKDDLSRRFRAVHKQKGNRVSLEEGILDAWRDHLPASKSVLGQLKGALLYRHWFAHGRYYIPKLGQNYDFFAVYSLARSIEQSVRLEY
jgi:hypothetical protein